MNTYHDIASELGYYSALAGTRARTADNIAGLIRNQLEAFYAVLVLETLNLESY